MASIPRSLFVWTGSISYEGYSSRLSVFVFIICMLYCVSFLLLLGAGLLASGKEGVPLYVFRGFLRVASLSGVTLVN